MTEFAWRSWRAADGVALAARDYPAAAGEAKLPVVCVHGLTRNSRDFEAVAPWLAGLDRRVLAVDVRGRGRSRPVRDPTSYQPAIYATDLIGLLDALGVAQAHVIGTSMGGLIAMTLAALAPERLAGAVLNDVGPGLAPAGIARIAAYAGKSPQIAGWNDAAAYVRELNGAFFPDYGEADWQAFARRLFREEGGRIELDYDPAIVTPMRPAEPGNGEAAAPDLWPLFEGLASGGRPLLLVRGALSDLLTAEAAQAMRDRAPAMAYAEVPRVGHAPMLTEPAARAAIEAFLNQVP
jgi:pimeloyl-ACP methyl ester carboxylesterase